MFAAVTTVAIRRLTSVELLPTPPAKYSGGFTQLHTTGWALLAAASLAAIVAAPGHLTSTCVQAFMLSATVLGFLVGSSATPGVKNVLHPLITCAAAANAAAYVAGALSGVGWESVLRAFLTKGKAGAPWGAGDLLMAFLHSVILSFGFRVFAQRQLMRRHWAEVGATVVASSAFSMLSSCAIGAAMALPPGLSLALAPRCVTVALALPISAMLGAGSDASLTAAAVVFTGLLGANFAQSLLTAFGFTDPVVRGLATAASAHGLGTAALAGKEPEALPMAALAVREMIRLAARMISSRVPHVSTQPWGSSPPCSSRSRSSGRSWSPWQAGRHRRRGAMFFLFRRCFDAILCQEVLDSTFISSLHLSNDFALLVQLKGWHCTRREDNRENKKCICDSLARMPHDEDTLLHSSTSTFRNWTDEKRSERAATSCA